MNRTILTILSLFLLLHSANAQLMTAAKAKKLGSGTTVTLAGVITASELGSNIRYMQDASGGIALYGTAAADATRGDSVVASGTISPYNGLTELVLTTITVVSHKHALPAPVVVSIKSGFSEEYESKLVWIKGIKFTNTGDFTGGTNYNITDGTDSAQVRINGSTNIAKGKIPLGNVDVTGIMGHYKTIFQLLPRDSEDINKQK